MEGKGREWKDMKGEGGMGREREGWEGEGDKGKRKSGRKGAESGEIRKRGWRALLVQGLPSYATADVLAL